MVEVGGEKGGASGGSGTGAVAISTGCVSCLSSAVAISGVDPGRLSPENINILLGCSGKTNFRKLEHLVLQ